MTPVRQTRNDNCVAACVASVLDLPLESVPDFKPLTWGEELIEWLLERGWCLINIVYPDDVDKRAPLGYSIGRIPAGLSWPEGFGHCVVCLDGRIIWDPFHGEQPGTERAEEYTILYPLNPANILKGLL